jgi:hypothetical protein
MYDVPPLGRPFRPRGTRHLTLTLDEFAPTHLDAWLATATVGGETVQAVVVRHAGDVARGGGRLLGARRQSPPWPPPEPGAVLAVVVTERGAALSWLPPGDRARYAADLSRQVDPAGGGP